jgi:hypothetical protein
MRNRNSPRSPQKLIYHPFYEGLFVKPFFGVRGFVLAFRNIFESSEFGDAKHPEIISLYQKFNVALSNIKYLESEICRICSGDLWDTII